MKLIIWIGIAAGSLAGSWAGAVLLDNGDYLGVWSIIFGGLGAMAGLCAGYMLNRAYFE